MNVDSGSVLSGYRLLRAVGRRWLLVLSVPTVTVLLALLFIFLVPPLFESRATIRFLEDQTPLGGSLTSALGQGGGGGLSLLAGLAGRSVPTQTEIEVLRSRELAAVIMDELGLRLELRRPSRVRYGVVFQDVLISDEAPEGKFTLDRLNEGEFRITASVVTERDVFRPILNERRAQEDFGSARVGEVLPIPGTRIILSPEAADFKQIRFRVHAAQDALDDLQELISVDRPRRDADVVSVRVRWTDPEIAAETASLMATRFIERREEFLGREYGRTSVFLSMELDSLREELVIAEENLRAYREIEGIVEPEAQATAAVEQLTDLQVRRDLLAVEQQALTTLVDEIQGNLLNSPESVEESPYRRLVYFPTLLANTATAELLRLLGELENEKAALLDRRTSRAREVQVLNERVDELEEQLRSVAQTYLEGLENQVESLDELLLEFRAQLDQLPAVELEYLRRKRQVEVLTELYVFMEMRQKEAEITAEGESGGARVIDAAEVPIEPVRPRPLLTLLMSAIAGLGIGIAGAFALENSVSAFGEVSSEVAG